MSVLRLQSPAFRKDPHPALAQLLSDGPIGDLRIPILGKIAFTIHHAASLEMLKSTDRFVMDGRKVGRRSPQGIPFLPKTLGLLATNMLTQDDPEHRRLRQLSDQPFRRTSIEALQPAIAAQVARHLDAMTVQATQTDGVVDIVSMLSRPLPIEVISDLLGLSAEARPAFVKIMGSFGNSGSLGAIFKILGNLGQMRRVFSAEIARARKAPLPGLMADLIAADDGEGRLSDDELFSMIFMLYVAGHETTTHLISTGLYTLLTVEGAWDTFKAGGDEGGLAAVDELVRYCSTVQISNPRFVLEDMEFHGRHLKRGERIMALLAAGNLDDEVFDMPLSLDLGRERNRHLGWGGGPHLCLGLHLAKAEVRTALLDIARRWPDISLAVPTDNLEWVKRAGVRGLQRLPVRLSP